MVEYQTFSRLAFLSVIQTFIPVLLVITTRKGSPLRYLSLPCMLWILSLMLYPVQQPNYVTVSLGGGGWVGIITALDMLLINPKDASDFVDANGKTRGFFSRLQGTLELSNSPRKINTPREAKNTPNPPIYYTQGGSKAIPRGLFLVRETAIAAWQYLVLDILTIQSAKAALEKQAKLASSETLEVSLAEVWIERLIIAIAAWFITARILISFYYRVVSISLVALGLETPEMCPPMFNRMSDAYTLRNFWGKFWHQNLRVNFTAVSSFVTRDILHLPKPSILERYTNIFLVFFLSGILHIATDTVLGISLRESGAMTFFLSFTFGYMIEDGVQAAWKRLRGAQKASEEPKLWQKAIGFIWVVAFLTVVSAGFLQPMQARPDVQMAMAPWSVVERVGLDVVGGIVVVGGVILKFVFKGEI